MLDAPWKLKAMSAGGYLTLVGGLLIASRRTGDRNLMALTGVVALHPTLIFATGSGIEEPIVAGAFAIVAWGVLAFDGSRRPVAALAVVLGFAIVIGVNIHPSSAWLSLLTLLPMGIWSVLQDPESPHSLDTHQVGCVDLVDRDPRDGRPRCEWTREQSLRPEGASGMVRAGLDHRCRCDDGGIPHHRLGPVALPLTTWLR